MGNESSFRWIHISDLHAGQSTQDWLWPTLQTSFFDDLERIVPALGGLDFVVFSGDLTQHGSKEDFDKLRSILERLWEKFGKIGCHPSLILIPGNHDLARPDPKDPITVALRSWWDRREVKEAFWENRSNAYRGFVDGFFYNFVEFKNNLRKAGFPLVAEVEGVIPGDFSYVFSKDGYRLGIVGLNSSYLHFCDLDEGTLDLDVRQLLAVTDNDPDAWCRKNSINFLVTHHPENWLSLPALRHFREEIYPAGRFVAHLFGHMHDQVIHTNRQGGSAERKMFQAASLYGLRKYGSDKVDRTHGYAGVRIEIDDSGGRMIIWPRIDQAIDGGGRSFVPNTRLGLTEENNFALNLGNLSRTEGGVDLQLIPSLKSFGSAQEDAASAAQGSLSPIIGQPLKAAPQHSVVRRLEQAKLKKAIETHRRAWVSADWGYAAEEFISSVIDSLSSPISTTYRIDLSDYLDRDSFLTRFSLQAGCSFQEFCKSISGSDRVLLLLEGAPVSRPTAPESADWESEIESIVDAISEYCANSIVVLLSRQSPRTASSPRIEIKPLDEPDILAYVQQHPSGGSELAGPNEVADLLRMTGGLPIEIDSILRELEFISLAELVELRLTSPLMQSGLEGQDSLIPIIENLRNSTDPQVSRAFALLVALSAFPYGETLIRIRRFDPHSPVYPSQAAILSDRGLVESIAVTPALRGANSGAAISPKLVVKKSVRDTVEGLLSPEELDQRNSRAAVLYFGEKWMVGEPKSIRATDLAKALGSDGGLGNPHAVINALLRRAIEGDDARRIAVAIQLARLFIGNLASADNFRHCMLACQDFLKIVPAYETYEGDRNVIKATLARCLRMLGRYESAIEICNELENVVLDRRTKQRLLLNLALALQRSNKIRALEVAESVIALKKGTFSAMQAEALILQLSPDEPDRSQKLRLLEQQARKKKAITVANNISYYMTVGGDSTVSEKRDELKAIATSAKRNGDPYNAAQAIVEIGRIVTSGEGALSRDEMAGLIEAYHYLYNERMDALFRRCHDALWCHFLKNDDFDNLLRIFRHSSFIWRVHGQDSLEVPYIDQLLKITSSNLGRWTQLETTESAYFLMRSGR